MSCVRLKQHKLAISGGFIVQVHLTEGAASALQSAPHRSITRTIAFSSAHDHPLGVREAQTSGTELVLLANEIKLVTEARAIRDPACIADRKQSYIGML